MLCAVAFAFLAGFAFTGSALAAADKGPAEITLESTVDAAAKPKPAVFPHAKHQEKFACGDCHHGKDDAGKQVPYADGQEIGKCESCHNKAAGMAKPADTFKNAAHKNCKDCHKAQGAPNKCSTCHPKK